MLSVVKNCPNCNAEIESGFEICWKCQYSFADQKVIEPEETDSAPTHYYSKIQCLRCAIPMSFAGVHEFHEGTRWGAFGDLFELFVNKDSFDLFVCPQCGKVEFFISVPRKIEDNVLKAID